MAINSLSTVLDPYENTYLLGRMNVTSIYVIVLDPYENTYFLGNSDTVVIIGFLLDPNENTYLLGWYSFLKIRSRF